MRIGLVCRNFISTKGGLEKYSIRLSKLIRDLGHSVHVFARKWEPIAGIIFHKVPMVPVSSPAKQLSFALMSARRISSLKLDVVQSMERIWQQDIFRASDGINPVQMLEKYPAEWMRKFKAAGPRRQVLTLLEKHIFLYGGCRFVMTNSQLVKNQIMDHYGVPSEKIIIIYNSVDTNRFTSRNREEVRKETRIRQRIDKDANVIFFAGNDFQRKGLSVLIKAVAGLKREDVMILVAGSDRTAPYERLANDLGIRGRVKFLGGIEKLEKFYLASDLFVLPTRYDAFANVCLEAMACATPVITTVNNGAGELIHEDKNGYLLKTWEAGELTGFINAFFKKGRRGGQEMGRNARKLAEKFTSQTYMEKLMQLYSMVLESKK